MLLIPHAMRACAFPIQGPSICRQAMQNRRAQAPGFTLYQLLVSLVALAMAVSLSLAYHHSRHPKPFFADLERVESE